MQTQLEKRPTLNQVFRQMKGFDDSLVYYVYHKMNGRDEEAESYLREWEEEQQEIQQAFHLKNEIAGATPPAHPPSSEEKS